MKHTRAVYLGFLLTGGFIAQPLHAAVFDVKTFGARATARRLMPLPSTRRLTLPSGKRRIPIPVCSERCRPTVFFVRHVKGLQMDDVDMSYAKDEMRPAIVL